MSDKVYQKSRYYHKFDNITSACQSNEYLIHSSLAYFYAMAMVINLERLKLVDMFCSGVESFKGINGKYF